jgi:hypothetical protein
LVASLFSTVSRAVLISIIDPTSTIARGETRNYK